MYRKTFLTLLSLSLVLSGCNKAPLNNINSDDQKPKLSLASQASSQVTSEYPVSSIDEIVEKLEVYYFHRTARCRSCTTIGKFTKETIEQDFSKQISDGLIDYREINVDLPENKDLAKKFEASGSSLYINRIIDSDDNIELDTNVWRLLSDEEKFKNYLRNKINSYLNI